MLSGVFNKNEKGFTLIEIILISVIVLLIGVSIIVPFRGGKKTWQSADKDSETIQNAVIGMEKVVREIKNSPGLTAFATTAIRFAILRKDDDPNDPDIDLDGITDEYVTKYAMVKKDGDYLKYGERSADSASEGDWTLSDLAYPVTNLSFSFKKANGDDANPGDDPADVKSILINLTTSDGGVTIPLTSRAYLVMGESSVEYNFDGTPDDPDDEGEDDTTLTKVMRNYLMMKYLLRVPKVMVLADGVFLIMLSGGIRKLMSIIALRYLAMPAPAIYQVIHMNLLIAVRYTVTLS